MKNKTILAAASYEKQKYYFEPEFNLIPSDVKNDIKTICVLTAQKLLCTFIIGFYDDGQVYFEIDTLNRGIDFDDIGAELEIKKIRNNYKELLNGLQIWYLMFKTQKYKDIL